MARPSGVYFEEEQESNGNVSTVTDPITLMQLVTERGPLTPTFCGDDAEFARIFGGPTANNKDSYCAAMQYYGEGGRGLIVGRVVHHTDTADPLTATCAAGTLQLMTEALVAGSGSVLSTIAAPYNLDANDTIVLRVNGGGTATATFTATRASRTSANGPFALTNGMTLLVTIPGAGAQTITFTTGEFVAIGAATAAEVAASINGKLSGGRAVVSGSAVRIETDQLGSGASLNITGGSSNAVLAFATGAVAGTGNVANIDAVTSAEVKTVIEAAVAGVTVTNEAGFQRIRSNTSGVSSSIQVDATSLADDEMGFDNALHSGTAAGAVATIRVDGKTPGAYANEIRCIVSAPTNGESGRFNLAIERAGVIVKRYADLSADSSDGRYFEKVVNSTTPGVGDDLIQLTNLNPAAAYPANVPAVGTFGPLTGGNDGLVGLADTDFIGGIGPNGGVGMRAFDGEDGDMMASPQRATPAVALALFTYCLTTRNGMIYPIHDAPEGYSYSEIVTYWKDTVGLYELTETSAIHWPRGKVTNPNRALYGDVDTVVSPTSGMVSGIVSRVESSKEAGVFDPPAGNSAPYLPRTLRGLETNEVLDDTKRGIVFEANINPITRKRDKRPGQSGQFGPIYIDGARNAKTSGAWPSISQRRGIIWVKKQVDAILDPTRHRTITDDLIRLQRDKVVGFMRQLTRTGQLGTTDPNKAFIVIWDASNNTASTRKAGHTNGKIGLATGRPNEFVFVKIGPDNRALEVELAAA